MTTAAVKTEKHMYRGYHFKSEPIQSNHDPKQWREHTTYTEHQNMIPIQIVYGWQQRRFLGDIEDRKII